MPVCRHRLCWPLFATLLVGVVGCTDSQIESGQAESGQVESGQVESGQVESGQVESGQAAPTAAHTLQSAPVVVGNAPVFMGTWTGTASPTPTTWVPTGGGRSLYGLVLPVAVLGNSALAIQPVSAFTWTITCATTVSGLGGSYSDTAGRSGTFTGTADRDTGAVSLTVVGTQQGQVDYGLGFTMVLQGVLASAVQSPAVPEWEITRASILLAGESRVSLTSDAHLLPDFLTVEWQDTAVIEPQPEAVIQPQLNLLEDDILDP